MLFSWGNADFELAKANYSPKYLLVYYTYWNDNPQHLFQTIPGHFAKLDWNHGDLELKSIQGYLVGKSLVNTFDH